MNKPELTIITSPEAERMRQMVTSGFYDRSRIGLWLFEVIGREYDDMAEWARTLRDEAFPQTATWSIPFWEFVYGFEPDDTLPLEFRRERILSKRLQRPPINPARIEAILSALTGYPVTIIENIAPYTFRVLVSEGESIYDYRQALKVLREIKPSHLTIQYESVIVVDFWVTDYYGGATAEWIREFITGDTTEIQTEATDYTAGAGGEWLREYMDEYSAIRDTADDYHASAIYEFTREQVSDGTN